ncbi:hypothetical protein D0Z08_25450 [Nocardioides immobilis]|uniref:Uncharacterized protein n=1 Tax=Nocardioides immobilis TaxID=2049295 RepID=A0A417XVF9_9ACTN|nr:hypothetical protein [Nocardioides immobilis]RHW24260.1 hypothetical protein D0Z08_25450 [Nocardioides immobilis]
MTDHDTLELRRIVDADPAHAGSPDLPALIGSGRQSLARRRSLIGGTALAAAAAIVVPTVLLTGGAGDSGTDAPPAASPSTATSAAPRCDWKCQEGRNPVQPPDECGVIICLWDDEPQAVERAELTGEPWVIGALPRGGRELFYPVRIRGTDPTTGEGAMVDVVMSGYQRDGKLYRHHWAWQPGAEDGDFLVTGGFRDPWAEPGSTATFKVDGFVDGTYDDITWTAPGGLSGTAVSNTSLVPGHTVFYLTGTWHDAWDANRPAPITVHVPDGRTCSVNGGQGCAVQGGS